MQTPNLTAILGSDLASGDLIIVRDVSVTAATGKDKKLAWSELLSAVSAAIPEGPQGPQGEQGLLPAASQTGAMPYWDGSNWVYTTSSGVVTNGTTLYATSLECSTSLVAGSIYTSSGVGVLYDASNLAAITWASRQLVASNTVDSLDWENKTLRDSSGTQSGNWGNRQLISNDGSTVAIAWASDTGPTIKYDPTATLSYWASGSSAPTNIKEAIDKLVAAVSGLLGGPVS